MDLEEAIQNANEKHDELVMSWDLLKRELERRGLVTPEEKKE